MPSRRRYLSALGASAASVGLAGCSARSLLDHGDPPAGSLRFSNRDDLPHTLGVAVTAVGTTADGPDGVTGDPVVPPAQRRLSARSALDSGESTTYRNAFTEAVWYRVVFTADGDAPRSDAARAVAFTPSTEPDDGRGQYLEARVSRNGEFAWAVAGTGNPGRFS